MKTQRFINIWKAVFSPFWPLLITPLGERKGSFEDHIDMTSPFCIKIYLQRKLLS